MDIVFCGSVVVVGVVMFNVCVVVVVYWVLGLVEFDEF